MRNDEKERVFELRKRLGLTQQEMGDVLGLSKSAMGSLEQDYRRLTDRLILSICREFNVNEEWLRTGEGEMFRDVSEGAIEEMAREGGLSDEEVRAVRAFCEMDAAKRRLAVSAIKKLAGLSS